MRAMQLLEVHRLGQEVVAPGGDARDAVLAGGRAPVTSTMGTKRVRSSVFRTAAGLEAR